METAATTVETPEPEQNDSELEKLKDNFWNQVKGTIQPENEEEEPAESGQSSESEGHQGTEADSENNGDPQDSNNSEDTDNSEPEDQGNNETGGDKQDSNKAGESLKLPAGVSIEKPETIVKWAKEIQARSTRAEQRVKSMEQLANGKIDEFLKDVPADIIPDQEDIPEEYNDLADTSKNVGSGDNYNSEEWMEKFSDNPETAIDEIVNKRVQEEIKKHLKDVDPVISEIKRDKEELAIKQKFNEEAANIIEKYPFANKYADKIVDIYLKDLEETGTASVEKALKEAAFDDIIAGKVSMRNPDNPSSGYAEPQSTPKATPKKSFKDDFWEQVKNA